MKQPYINEKSGIRYTLQSDYYMPNLTLLDEGNKPIGIWVQRRLRYVRQHRKVLYINLFTSGRLNGYLADVNEQAETMFLGYWGRWQSMKV